MLAAVALCPQDSADNPDAVLDKEINAAAGVSGGLMLVRLNE